MSLTEQLLSSVLYEALRGITTALDQLYEDNPILCDCVDNGGRPYTSAWLAQQMEGLARKHHAARAILARAERETASLPVIQSQER